MIETHVDGSLLLHKASFPMVVRALVHDKSSRFSATLQNVSITLGLHEVGLTASLVASLLTKLPRLRALTVRLDYHHNDSFVFSTLDALRATAEWKTIKANNGFLGMRELAFPSSSFTDQGKVSPRQLHVRTVLNSHSGVFEYFMLTCLPSRT